jgi:peptide/nickel transport system substrate-binding protein
VELTAEDVVYTYTTIQATEESQFRDRFLQDGEPIVFEATDKYTVTVKLTSPNASLLTDISFPILPKHILETEDLSEGPFNRAPIGTGPFVFSEWEAGQSITLLANDRYFGGRPCIDRLVIRIVPDEQAQVNALIAGEIDFLPNVPGSAVVDFEGNADFTVEIAETDTIRAIVFNLAQPQFQDVRVRQALLRAIDRQGLIDALLQGYGRVQNSLFGNYVPFYDENKLGGYAYDPAAAEALLDEAGITDTTGDGLRDLDGATWTVNLVTFSDFRNYKDVAELVAAYWQDVGVDVAIEQRDLATLVDQLYVTSDVEKPYDVHTTGWGQFGPEPNSYAGFFISSDDSANLANYVNEEVNELFAQARTVTDFDERMAIYEQIELILWEELPYLPLYHETQPVVYSARFNVVDAQLDLSIGTSFRNPQYIYEVGG